MFEPHARRPVQVVFPPEGVFVLESRHERDFRMPDTRHAFLKMVFVFAGAGRLVRPDGVDELEPDAMVLVPPDCLHRIEDASGTPLSLYAVCLQRELIARLPPTERAARQYRCLRHAPLAAEVRGLLRQMLWEQTLRRPGSGPLLLGLGWQILGLLTRAGGRESTAARASQEPARARVENYARELERGFPQATTIEEAARALGLSRRRFTQLFREVTGESWLRYVRDLRLAHARRLLRETNRSIASVCFECGFEDLSSFYRMFRQAADASPAAWREAAKRA